MNNMTLDITLVINNLIKKYKETPYTINNGQCLEFAEEVIEYMKGSTNDLFEIGADNIYAFRDPNFALENWGGKLIQTEHAVWSKNALDKHGHPPVDLHLIDDEINHVWICYNGKHYDAECPEGVENWCDLPLCKKFFERYK